MTRPTYTQSNVAYDYAIDGVPYFSAASADTPMVRETSDWRREQLDTSTEPGEQSLNDWWRRSQASFHLGAGLNFYDPAGEVVAYGRQRTQQYRFQASRGVDVWTPGQVKLLRKCTQGAAISSTRAVGQCALTVIRGRPSRSKRSRWMSRARATRSATEALGSARAGRIRSAADTAGTSIRRSMRSSSGPEMRDW